MRRDGSNKTRLLANLASPVGLALDWVAEQFYWTDDQTDVIEVCRLDGTARAVVVAGRLARPGPIAVSPAEGLLLWVDTTRAAPRLERAGLDGSGRATLTQQPDLAGVSSIALDTEAGWLYWANSDSGAGPGLGRIRYREPNAGEIEILRHKATSVCQVRLVRPNVFTFLKWRCLT